MRFKKYSSRFLLIFCFSILFLPLNTYRAYSVSSKPPVTDNVRDLFKELSKKLIPSVVNIYTSQMVKRHRSGSTEEEIYRQFFEQYFGAVPDRQGQPKRRASSLGSGFIIDAKEGLILTNYHVIAQADKVEVVLSGDKIEKGIAARIIGGDAEADIALLQIKTKRKLIAAPLGESAKLDVGEWVMAVGNPFGLGHTVTQGIVSAKGRVFPISQFANYIQTDAAINPGNSGGPLINSSGEVIGINTFINAAAQGIGFAIQIDYVKKILPDLRKEGMVTRGYIGISIQDLVPDLAMQLGLKARASGVVVRGVSRGGTAAKAGLRALDVIESVEGKPTPNTRALINTITGYRPGQNIKLRVYRNGKARNVKVRVSKRPSR